MVTPPILGSRRRKRYTFIRLVLAVGAVLIVWHSTLVSHTVSWDDTDDDKKTVSTPRIETHNHQSFHPNTITYATNERFDNSSHTVASERDDADVALVGSRYGDARQQQQTSASLNNTIMAWPFGQVEQIADSDNCIVIFIATCPYLEMLDNVIESLKHAHVTNYIVVPLDKTTFHVASKLYPDNTVSIPPFIKRVQFNSSEPATFGSREFQALTASRPMILSAFLKIGYTVFYCDTDTVWKSNPMNMLHKYSKHYDLVAMIDNHINGEVCSCYLYLKPTSRTVYLLNRWNDLIQTNRFQHDQAAFHAAYQQLRNDTSIKLLEPDNSNFPNGEFYFKRFHAIARSQVAMVHNNFIFGYQEKKKRFMQHDLWHPSNAILSMEYKC